MLERDKKEWAEIYARRMKHRFEQWQKPLGIDGKEYFEYLREEFMRYCDEPDWKSLIESIS
jgi:hypothetical protein